MGDFFSEVVIFLEEYYVYVAGVGLIVILMLVGLLASRRKAKKAANSGEPMANINDVNTGSINDVASTLQSDVMQPVDVVAFPEENNTVVKEDALAPATPEVAPIVSPVSSIPSVATPFIGDAAINVSNTVTPIVEETKPIEEITPVDEEKFDKTEIIDFSSFEPVKPIETKPSDLTSFEAAKPIEAVPSDFTSFEPVTPVEPKANDFTSFVVDKSQYNDTDSILNGENSNNDEPKV